MLWTGGWGQGSRVSSRLMWRLWIQWCLLWMELCKNDVDYGDGATTSNSKYAAPSW